MTDPFGPSGEHLSDTDPRHAQGLRVSVIIYVLNAADTIDRAITSVLDQKYPCLELIVVDGGSTDGTVERIGRYHDRIAYFVSEPDDGAVYAANKGLGMATGDVVCFLMADDWYEPGSMEKIARTFERNPGVGLVSSGVRVVADSDGENFAAVVEISGAENDFTLANIMATPYGAARYFGRDALRAAGGLNPEYRISHDRELLLRMFLQGVKTAVIDSPLYTYRLHAGSRTLVPHPEVRRDALLEHVRMAEHYLDTDTLSRIVRRDLRDWHGEQCLRLAFREVGSGHWRHAMARVSSGMRYNPLLVFSILRRAGILLRRRWTRWRRTTAGK